MQKTNLETEETKSKEAESFRIYEEIKIATVHNCITVL